MHRADGNDNAGTLLASTLAILFCISLFLTVSGMAAYLVLRLALLVHGDGPQAGVAAWVGESKGLILTSSRGLQSSVDKLGEEEQHYSDAPVTTVLKEEALQNSVLDEDNSQ